MELGLDPEFAKLVRFSNLLHCVTKSNSRDDIM